MIWRPIIYNYFKTQNFKSFKLYSTDNEDERLLEAMEAILKKTFVS